MKVVDFPVGNIWTGRVDRLSGSANAMVKSSDAEPSGESDITLNKEVNIGPLPPAVVGKQVSFVYESGAFGLCLDEEWISESYLKDALPRVGISADETELLSAIIDANVAEEIPEGAVCTATPWIKNLWSQDDSTYSPLVKLQPEEEHSEEEQVYFGVLEGAVPPGDMPFKAQVIDKRERAAIVKANVIELASSPPEVGDTCAVRTKEHSTEGTIAVHDSDQFVHVMVRGVEYPLEERLDVRITDRKHSHLVAEPELPDPEELAPIPLDGSGSDTAEATTRVIKDGVPVDVRPLPAGITPPEQGIAIDRTDEALIAAWDVQADSDGHEHISAGETVEMELRSVDGDEIVGVYREFPIVCQLGEPLPDGLLGKYLSVRIQSIAPDRATATLAPPPFEEGDVVSIDAIGPHDGDVFAAHGGHLIRVASSGLITPGETFRVGIESVGPISRASVAALPELRPDTDPVTEVRLPSATGDVVMVEEVPVKTTELPDVTEPILLGIDSVESDHIVPSVTALPDSQVPTVGESLAVTVDCSKDTVTASAVGEQLPVELLTPPSVTLGRTYARVSSLGSDKLRAVATTITEEESIEGFTEQFQLAAHLVTVEEYTVARSVLSVAQRQLPVGYPILDAIVDARHALLSATDLFSDDIESSPVDNLHRARNKTAKLSEADVDGNLARLLEAYNSELEAAIACAEAHEDVDRRNVTQLQAIARGAEASRPVEEAIQKLRAASQRMEMTDFESAIPSAEMLGFLARFEADFPYPLDELAAWRSKHEARHASDEWLEAVLPGSTGPMEDGTSYHELTSTETGPGEVWERSLSTEETILGLPAEDSKRNQATTGKKPPETTAVDESVATGDTDGDIPNDAGDTGAEMAAETTSNSDYEADAPADRPAETIGSDSRPELPKSDPEDQEEEAHATDSEEFGDTESTDATELSASGPDEETKQADRETEPPTHDIPDATAELRELRRKAEADATENPVKESTTVNQGGQYHRSDKIREYALARADGRCEACGSPAPFQKPDGDPFLEVHHVDELGEGGADDPTSVVAICPNCHREIHYGEHGDQLNGELETRLEQGLGGVGGN